MRGRADAFDVGDAERLARRVVSDAAREPADRDEPAQAGLAGLEVEDRDGVLGAVANEELAARLVKGEGVGLGPEQIRGVLPRAEGLHDLVGAGVDDAERVAARVGDHDPASVGRDRQGAGAQAGKEFGVRNAECGVSGRRAEVNHGHRALARDVPDRVHAHQRAVTGGAGEVLAVGATPAPVAHISLLAGKRHVVGREANFPEPQHAPARGLQLGQPVGQIERDVEALPVRGHGEPRRDFRLAVRRFRGRQRDGKQTDHLPRLLDPENLDIAGHVRQVDAGAIG